MNDLAAISIFLGCFLATLGLVRVCEWLRPREQARPDRPAALTQETHP